ncbi:hypothetical protein [Mycobacteroides franklinii]|uniref:hypothetical protein n=1 Tax=Mycobacteroides franklinii TaxID=948102 RepID=UPI001F3079C6
MGLALVVVGVAGLHHLYRSGDSAGDWIVWVAVLLAWLTALGGGVKLATWGIKPVIDAVSEAAQERFSEAVQSTVAALGVVFGAVGLWWALRGGYAQWWQSISGEPGWSLTMGVGQMLVAVLAGAALFTGGKYLAGLTGQVLADAGLVRTENTAAHRNPADDGAGAESHPVLVAALAAGGLALVAMTVWLTPKLAPTVSGTNTVATAGAIAALLVWGVGANLGWWKGLEGLYAWATAASEKTAAVAGVIAVLMFSAGGLGLGWFTPATVPQAHAQCPPDCGGGSNGSNSYGPDASQFQPPQMPNQMPDYQGGNYGSNQAPLDQNSGISIYNTQAPSVSQSISGQSAQQSLQGSQTPQHGSQIPDYQSATPYTQGPGAPNPDYNGGQANPGTNTGSQGGQANQGAPQQQTPQQPPANQDQGQQPPQQSDQQKIDDLTKQLQDQQQQSTQDRQQLDDLTKQLQQQQGQQKQSNQKLPKAPSKDKKKDDQQDRDKQSGDNDLTALLLGAASTRRRKQGEQDQPEQGQQQAQGPDTQALTQDGAQMGQSLPGDITNTVSDGVNLGQSAGSAAQNFGSAAQAGASIASSAQSGAVNPMDAVALVQGISGGISDTADAVNSGTSIASTWLNEAGQGAQLAADANPQLKPQAQQVEQLTKTAGQVSDLTGQVASGVSQASGLVNTATSLGASGMPSGAPTDVGGAGDLLSEGGTVTPLSSGEAPIGGLTDTVQRLDQPAPQAPLPPTPAQPSTFGAISPPGGYEQDKADLNSQIPGFPTVLSGDMKEPSGGKLGAHTLSPGANANVNDNYKGVTWPGAPADGTLAFPNRALPTGVGYGADGRPLAGNSFPAKGGSGLGEFASGNTWLYDVSNPQAPQLKGQLPVSQGSVAYDKAGNQMVVVGNTGLNPSDSRAVWTAPVQPGDTPDKWIPKLAQKDSIPFASDGGDRENQIVQLKNGSWLLLDTKNGGGVRGFLSDDPATILRGTTAQISQTAPALDQMPPLPKGAASWQPLSGDSAYGASLAADNTVPGQGGSIVARVSYWATALNAQGKPLVDQAGNGIYLPMTFLQTVQINK